MGAPITVELQCGCRVHYADKDKMFSGFSRYETNCAGCKAALRKAADEFAARIDCKIFDKVTADLKALEDRL